MNLKYWIKKLIFKNKNIGYDADELHLIQMTTLGSALLSSPDLDKVFYFGTILKNCIRSTSNIKKSIKIVNDLLSESGVHVVYDKYDDSITFFKEIGIKNDENKSK